jgi:hypothetical protein
MLTKEIKSILVDALPELEARVANLDKLLLALPYGEVAEALETNTNLVQRIKEALSNDVVTYD